MLRWSRFNILNDMYRIHWVHEYTYTLIPLNTNTQRERHYRSIIIDILTFWTGLHLNSMWKWLIIITVFDELIGSELALHGWHIKNSGASMDTRLNKSYSHHIILYDSHNLLKIISLKVGMNFRRGFWLLMLFIPTYVLFSSTFWFEPEQKHTQKRLDNWLDLCMCVFETVKYAKTTIKSDILTLVKIIECVWWMLSVGWISMKNTQTVPWFNSNLELNTRYKGPVKNTILLHSNNAWNSNNTPKK